MCVYCFTCSLDARSPAATVFLPCCLLWWWWYYWCAVMLVFFVISRSAPPSSMLDGVSSEILWIYLTFFFNSQYNHNISDLFRPFINYRWQRREYYAKSIFLWFSPSPLWAGLSAGGVPRSCPQTTQRLENRDMPLLNSVVVLAAHTFVYVYFIDSWLVD